MILIFATESVAFAVPALAKNTARERDTAQTRPVFSERLFHIEGTLSCNRGAENQGEACALKLAEQDSGKIYGVERTAELMRLIDAGSKKVALEATFSDFETLKIIEIKAL